MVLDSVRTLVIWAFSMLIGWQTFQGLQLAGFVALLFGMCLYNDILIRQSYQGVRDLYIRRRYGNIENDSSPVASRPADDTEDA